jgi:hypothetical protein
LAFNLQRVMSLANPSFFLFCQYCPENPNSSPYNVYGEVCVIKKPVVDFVIVIDELRKERKVKISLI